MKMYVLVKSDVARNINVLCFTTLKAAQDKMVDSMNKIAGSRDLFLPYFGYVGACGYEVEIQEKRAYINNSDKVMFNIIEREIHE